MILMWRINRVWAKVLHQLGQMASTNRLFPRGTPPQLTDQQHRCPHPPTRWASRGNQAASWQVCLWCQLRMNYQPRGPGQTQLQADLGTLLEHLMASTSLGRTVSHYRNRNGTLGPAQEADVIQELRHQRRQARAVRRPHTVNQATLNGSASVAAASRAAANAAPQQQASTGGAADSSPAPGLQPVPPQPQHTAAPVPPPDMALAVAAGVTQSLSPVLTEMTRAIAQQTVAANQSAAAIAQQMQGAAAAQVQLTQAVQELQQAMMQAVTPGQPAVQQPAEQPVTEDTVDEGDFHMEFPAQ